MNAFGSFRRWMARRALKAAGYNLALVPPWVRHGFMATDFETLVAEAYRSNPTVYACQLILALTFPEPELWPWRMDADGQYKRASNHALRDLLQRPNPDMGEAELFKYVITYAPLGGNVYLWKERNRGRRVTGLWPFHDGQITVIPGRTTAEGLVAYYVLDTGDNSRANPFEVERFDNLPGLAIPKADMIQWKWMVDPLQPWQGMGALAASAGDIDLANEIRRYVYSLLKNDATPPIVVNMADGDEFTEAKADRLRSQWQEKLGGSNRGLPAFLEYGMSVTQLAFDLQKLQITDLRDGPDAAICMGYHISPNVVGAMIGLKNSTYNNQAEAREALAVDTLTPLWRSFASEVEQAMAGELGYGGEVRIRFDLSQVRALTENQDAMEKRLRSGLEAGALTRAEYRQGLGYRTGPEDEVYRDSLMTVWTPKNAPRTLPNGEPVKHRLPAGGAKDLQEQRERMRESINALRQVRAGAEKGLIASLENYFAGLGERVVERMQKANPAGHERKDQPPLPGFEDYLITPEDALELRMMLERAYLSVAAGSWEILNLMVESIIAFDQTNPAITAALANSGNQVTAITEETKRSLREALQYANEHGWSIQDLIDGDANQPGLLAIIKQTYQGRAENVARTELGLAQNNTTYARYKSAGVEHVMVFDNGFPNSHEFCRVVDGKVVTLDWMERNPLQHPRCVRAFGAIFDYQGDVFEEEQPW